MRVERERGEPGLAVSFSHHRDDSRMVRHVVRPWIRAGGSLADDVTLAASELVANVVEHTDDGGRVRLWDQDPLLLEVDDHEHGLPRLREHPDESGGRGLAIVGRLAESWGVRVTPSGKTVWATFRRPPA